MMCERCDGLMVSERICDLRGTGRDLCGEGYRCLLCGNLVDATILDNRRRSIDSVEGLNRTRPHLPQIVAA